MMWQIIAFVACWFLISIVAAFLLGRLFRRPSKGALNSVDALDCEPPAASDIPPEELAPEPTATLRK